MGERHERCRRDRAIIAPLADQLHQLALPPKKRRQLLAKISREAAKVSRANIRKMKAPHRVNKKRPLISVACEKDTERIQRKQTHTKLSPTYKGLARLTVLA